MPQRRVTVTAGALDEDFFNFTESLAFPIANS
jgi:hypothetical protein